MINEIFWGLMNSIASILKFVVVFIMLGFIFLLPFLLKGGWLLGLLIYGYPLMIVIWYLTQGKDIYGQEKGDRNENRK